MTLARRIWNGFRRLGGFDWSRECASGAPIPEEERCRALDCPSVALTELRPGRRGVISCLEAPAGLQARKLASLGLLPGADLSVEQSFPAFVVRVGYSELALDRELARHVRVHPVEDRSAA